MAEPAIDAQHGATEPRFEAPGWSIFIESREEVGFGRSRHVEYQARIQRQVTAADQSLPGQALRFRFSELARLRQTLAQVPELADVNLPALPPKMTMRSLVRGNNDEAFQADRALRVQAFIEALFAALGTKYSEVGNFMELCEPIGIFMQQAAQRGDAAEAAAAAAAVRSAEAAEDRETRAQQDAEYEESLRRDREAEEARAKAAALEAEAARARADAEQEAQRRAAEKATALKERRAAFEIAHPVPSEGTPQASIRLRGQDGATLTRAFAATSKVSVLFEFAEVADWPAAPVCKFDLRTTFPVKSLRACKEQTLEEAKLCPSAALLVAVEDEEEDEVPAVAG